MSEFEVYGMSLKLIFILSFCSSSSFRLTLGFLCHGGSSRFKFDFQTQIQGVSITRFEVEVRVRGLSSMLGFNDSV